MTTTIDKAGRMVIPAEVREKMGFKPGTLLEVTADTDGVHIRRVVPGPELVFEGGIWFSRPTVPSDQLPDIDIERIIDEERERWPW